MDVSGARIATRCQCTEVYSKRLKQALIRHMSPEAEETLRLNISGSLVAAGSLLVGIQARQDTPNPLVSKPMTTLPNHPPPSTTSYILATAILGLAGGYLIGQASSLGLFPSSRSSSKQRTKKESWPNSYDVTIHPDSSDEELMTHLKGGKEVPDSENEDGEEAEQEGELKAFEGNREECKLVLVVRTDLGMGKGVCIA